MALITYYAWKIKPVTLSAEEDLRLLTSLDAWVTNPSNLRSYLQLVSRALAERPQLVQDVKFLLAPWSAQELEDILNQP